MIDLKYDELALELCRLLETPPVITARDARQLYDDFQWYSCIDHRSPLGWWVAEIGTDHGPDSDDDLPVRWRPLPEITDQIEVAWRVINEMKSRGWLTSLNHCYNGWIANCRQYRFYGEPWDPKTTQLSSGFAQEIGDDAPEAICRAALYALRSTIADNGSEVTMPA